MNGHANALRLLGRFDEALRGFARAIELNPTHPVLRANHAQLTLLLGDLEHGFRNYESRLAMLPPRMDELAQRPLWLGQPLAGKRIVLHGEQGLGDTIQFARYVEQVAHIGGTVFLEVQRPLAALFAGHPNTAGVFGQGEALPPSDYRCSLMSLPFRFGTRLDTIPPQRLQVDARRLEMWRARIGTSQRLRVGVCWSGSTTHGDDHNRSMTFAQFAQALPAGASYFSVQRDVRASDAAALAARSDVMHFGDALEDFADTAAIVELMDVVVSVDTAVAHVAGALGKKLWLLLPLVPDWRWLLEREDSPWYPSARLFRQSRLGDWTVTLARVREELTEAMRARNAA